MTIKLFGFEFFNKKEDTIDGEKDQKTFSLPVNDDGAITVSGAGHFGTYVDLDGTFRSESQLITKYREMSIQPEMVRAIDEITNEAIVSGEDGEIIDINMDELKQPENIKRKLRDEFKHILKLLNFKNKGYDIFKRWYIDGRIFYHIVIDEKNLGDGIKEIRFIDPRRIRKIREIQKVRDPGTGIELIKKQIEYYIYNERGILGAGTNLGSKIAVDSIINVNSGLMDPKQTMVLSHLHQAIKPLNNLRMVEDAIVIYRLSRAPERRIFYIDVGNMPTIKADQYIRDIMTKYRNKLVYDASTGEVKDDRKHLSMLEDFWLPRREGSKGTEISTLQGGQNLGQLDDVRYFQNKLYKSLNIPISRLEPTTGFSLGRTTEITRDELNFNKFVVRLQNRFSSLFDEILKTQLVLKKICTEEEWNEFKEDIWYDYRQDNNFDELKDAELMTNRLNNVTIMQPFVGMYYSKDWIRRNVLKQTEEDIEEIDMKIQEEKQSELEDQMAASAFDSAQQTTNQIQQQTAMNAVPPAPPPPQQETPPDPNKKQDQKHELKVLDKKTKIEQIKSASKKPSKKKVAEAIEFINEINKE